jgi:hypothetical protein
MAALPSSQVKTKPKSNKNATATQAKKETDLVSIFFKKNDQEIRGILEKVG